MQKRDLSPLGPLLSPPRQLAGGGLSVPLPAHVAGHLQACNLITRPMRRTLKPL